MEWKRPLLIGVGWGLGWGFGTAVGLVGLVGGFVWYQSRPKPPKPWNTSAIKAEYVYVQTERDKNTIVFYYTLENSTDFDYRVEDGHDIVMNKRFERKNNLSRFTEHETIDYPILVPARKRVEFVIHLRYECPECPKKEKALEKYIADRGGDLDGFDLLDESKRYEIIFPAGWKHSSKQAGAH